MFTLEIYSPGEWNVQGHMIRKEKTVEKNVLRCPMPGLITDVRVEEGEQIYRGQELMRIESMKMESVIASPCDGLIERVYVSPGNTVESDEELLRFSDQS